MKPNVYNIHGKFRLIRTIKYLINQDLGFSNDVITEIINMLFKMIEY